MACSLVTLERDVGDPLSYHFTFPWSPPFYSLTVSLWFLIFFSAYHNFALSFILFVFYLPFFFLTHTYPRLPKPSLFVSPQLHPQWELFLLLVFCGRVTLSALPAPSLGTLCKSVCVLYATQSACISLNLHLIFTRYYKTIKTAYSVYSKSQRDCMSHYQ